MLVVPVSKLCSDGFQAIVDQCPMGIIVQRDARVLYVNRAGLDCLGFSDTSEAEGLSIEAMLEPKSYATLACNFEKMSADDDQLFMGDLQLRHRSGTLIDAEVQHLGLSFDGRDATMISFRDITATKRMELELRQAQKLESIGRLAAGVAHEINTPIQYIGDSAHFLQEFASEVLGLLDKSRAALGELAGGAEGTSVLLALTAAEETADLDYLREQGPRAIERIIDGVSRVACIVSAMKSFSHPGAAEAVPMDINKMLTDTLVIAGHEVRNAGTVVTDLADLPPMMGYPGELNQAFLNLVVNAAHAIADRGEVPEPGRLTVSTRHQHHHVEITIADNGCGMPTEVQARLFEPFFTTKEVGRGTGQGLAVVRAAAEKHGGIALFESTLGVGTTFTLRLPISAAASEFDA